MCHFKELATTEYGCSCLNDYLKLIYDVKIKQLLENIADKSNFLVNDPWVVGAYFLDVVFNLMMHDFPP